MAAIHVSEFSTMEPDSLKDGTREFEMVQSHEGIESALIREKMECVTLMVNPYQVWEPSVESATVAVMPRDCQ